MRANRLAMPKRRTKIVCTLGPACETEDGIRGLVQAGMNVARLNFSHGTHDWHRARIETVRKVAREEGVSIAILQDPVRAQTEARNPARDAVGEKTSDPAEAMIQATCALGADLDLAAIVCWTDSGEMPLRLARTRPRAPILAVTSKASTYARLALSWGVEPILCEEHATLEDRLTAATEAALGKGYEKGALVAVLVPEQQGRHGGRLLELVSL